MVKDYQFAADELANLLSNAIDLAFQYSRRHKKSDIDAANLVIKEVFECLELALDDNAAQQLCICPKDINEQRLFFDESCQYCRERAQRESENS